MSGCCPHCGLSRPSEIAALAVTPKQRRLLRYFEDRAKEGVSPSYDEILRDLSYKSKGGVSATIAQLEARGYIRRAFGRWRSIVVVGFAA